MKITAYIIKRRKDPRKSGVFRRFLGAYFAQFTDWCTKKNSPSEEGRATTSARPPQDVAKASRRGRIQAFAQASERQPPPRKPGRGQRPTGAGEGIQLPRAEEKTRADAPPRKQRSNAATTRRPRPRAPRTRARAQPPQGRGRGGRRAASEAPPGSQNPQRRRHKPETGAQRTRAPHDGAPRQTASRAQSGSAS